MSGMSTWTSSPEIFLAALCCAAVIFCASLGNASAFRGEQVEQVAIGATSLPVLEDSVVISAPNGYCIDPLATLAGQRAAFVMMGSCRAITGDVHATEPQVHGLLTASVGGGAKALPSHGELSRFFASPDGRAALSRTGDPKGMELGTSYSRGGVFYLHASEYDGDPAMGGQSWRAVFEINGRTVTATLRDLPGHPIPANEGFRTVERLVDQIIAASPH